MFHAHEQGPTRLAYILISRDIKNDNWDLDRLLEYPKGHFTKRRLVFLMPKEKSLVLRLQL